MTDLSQIDANPHDTIVFHLKEKEVGVYDMLCRHVDVDPPDKYREGRRVEAPLFHHVDVSIAFIDLGSEKTPVPETDEEAEDFDVFDAAENWVDVTGGIMRKFVKAADEDQTELMQAMFDSDPRVLDMAPPGFE